jgi:glycosyltransferase involved in cell wall biosynthesis
MVSMERDSLEVLPTLSVIIMHLNDSESIIYTLESVKDLADEIIILDGGSYKYHLDAISDFMQDDSRMRVVVNAWRGIDGLQRNRYLQYPSCDWVLVIDSDEVLSDNGFMLKEVAQDVENRFKNGEVDVPICFNVHMEHFVYNYSLVDATLPRHYVPRRFWKRVPGLWYPLTKHNVLQGIKESQISNLDEVTIFHYSHTKGMHKIIEKYRDGMKRSNTQDPKWFKWWKDSLLNGDYPVKKFEGKHPWPVQKILDEDPTKVLGNYYVVSDQYGKM